MSPKRLLPLVVILIVLGVLAILFKRSPAPPQLAQEVGLERLVPPTLHADSITGFELYRGAQPQEVVRLHKRDGIWVVTSRFDTSGNSTKIAQFLTQLSTLQGELRADSTALLGDFQLTDEQALHLKVYTDTPDKPALYLLAGKGSGGNGFVRRAGEGRVYQVNVHVQSLAGLTSGTAEQALSAKPWLDLRIQNVPKEQVAAVELHSPTRDLRFTTQPAAAAGGPDASQTSAAPPAPVWTRRRIAPSSRCSPAARKRTRPPSSSATKSLKRAAVAMPAWALQGQSTLCPSGASNVCFPRSARCSTCVCCKCRRKM